MVSADGDLDLSGAPNIEVLSNPGARGGFGLNKAHFTSVSGKLFPNDPSTGDIKQQQIGDCYLLAGVLAILVRKGGPETIGGMMKEVGGRVVVRLYDTSGKPRFVSVEKSIRRNEEKHNGGAIWATLLEKAYAAASFVEENKVPDETPGGKVVVGYAKINAGGHSHDVFKTLLGGDADRKNFDAGNFDGTPGLPFMALWSVDDANKIEQHRIAKIIQDVFEGNGRLWTSFLHWRTNFVKGQWQTLLDAHGDIQDAKGDEIRRRALRQDDLAEFFVKFSLDRECATKVMDYVQKHKLLPGKRGSGVYNESQRRNFDRIKKALEDKKPVALATVKEVAAVTTGKGKSANEAMGKGLVGQHVYAVISVREDVMPPFLKWIRVRNPWGETGREYYPSPQVSSCLNKPTASINATHRIQ